MSDRKPYKTDQNQNKDSSINADVNAEADELMCWKDIGKVCHCKGPKRGVYCGRFPLPTD